MNRSKKSSIFTVRTLLVAKEIGCTINKKGDDISVRLSKLKLEIPKVKK